MLRTLLKYDFKRTKRLAMPVLYVTLGVTALSALVLFLTLKLENFSLFHPEKYTLAIGLIEFFLAGTLLLCIFTIFCSSQILQLLLYVDFYKSTATDEAYLTFTLPVKNRDLLFSKLFVVLSWSFLQMIVTGLGILLLIFVGGMAGSTDFLSWFVTIPLEVADLLAAELGLVFNILSIVLMLIAYWINTTMLYLMAIFYGSVLVRKQKLLGVLGCVLLAGFVYGIVMTVLQYVYIIVGAIMLNFIFISWVAFFLLMGLTVLFFVLTVRMMNKKLNLA